MGAQTIFDVGVPLESRSYSRRLPALGWISSHWHSEHWAEITLRQHLLRPSRCFVLIKQSDSPCPLQFWAGCSLNRESPRAFLARQLSPRTIPLSTSRRQVASAQLKHQNKDPCTQPSEPILFPKLRIYLADFPYLLFPMDQRLLTLETWCGYEYGLRLVQTLPWVFTDRPRRTGQVIRSPALPCYPPYLRIIRFHGRQQCQIEKKTLPGAWAGVPKFERVTA